MRTAIPVEDHILPVVGLNRIVSGAEITTGGEQAGNVILKSWMIARFVVIFCADSERESVRSLLRW